MCCGEARRPRLSLRAPAAPEHRPSRVPAPVPPRDIAVPGMHEPYRSSPVHHRAAPRTFVRVRGCARIERVHPIMTSFSDLGLIEPILRAVATEGYSTPTPIQAAAIPALPEGRALPGVAPTGPGTTPPVLLPLPNGQAPGGD